MYRKCMSNSNISTKNVQTIQNLYKVLVLVLVQTKNGLKLEMYVFCIQTMNNVQTIQNLYN